MNDRQHLELINGYLQVHIYPETECKLSLFSAICARHAVARSVSPATFSGIRGLFLAIAYMSPLACVCAVRGRVQGGQGV
eukprot:1894939-Rhodomonas_salina.4